MSDNQLTGAAGEALVSLPAHHELRWVYRDMRQLHVGVDGQVEIVKNCEATGLLMAVRVKTGLSEFREPAHGDWVYRPKNPDNLDYWLRYPMPVLIVLTR
jgi:hypothetical protein